MQVHNLTSNRPVRDLIVNTNGHEVIVELDVQNNDLVRVDDQYSVTWGDGTITVLRVTSFRSAEHYTDTIERAAAAQREGVIGIPQSLTARRAFQTKLAVMRIEGELLPDGTRRVGASRVPDLMLPVERLSDANLKKFVSDDQGNLILGRLRSGTRTLDSLARLEHIYAGERMLIIGMPSKGKTQLVRAALSQEMAEGSVEETYIDANNGGDDEK